CGEALGIDLDSELALVLSPRIHLRDARDTGESIADVVIHQRRELDGVEVARESDDHDGEAGCVELPKLWAHDILGQLAHLVFQTGAHLDGSGVDVGAPTEGHPNFTAPFGRGRRKLLDTGNGGDDL